MPTDYTDFTDNLGASAKKICIIRIIRRKKVVSLQPNSNTKRYELLTNGTTGTDERGG